MRRLPTAIVLVLAVLICQCQDSSSRSGSPDNGASEFLGEGDYLGSYWPTDDWRSCRPEEVGIDSDRLIAVYEYAANPEINTEGLVIVRDGYIVGEAYFRGYDKDERHYSYSVAKSFTSALVGIAIAEGYLDGVEEPVYQFYPEWQTPETPALKKDITITHLLTMTSGIQWDESDYYSGTIPNDAYIMHQQADMIGYVLNKPMAHPPGTRWNYSTGNSQLLSGVFESAAGQTAYEFALDHLLEPIGLTAIGWDQDAAGHTHTGSGIHATAREYAKFGYLYLMDGAWDGRQVVPQEWIEESRQPVSAGVPWYGYHWWRKPALDGHAGSIVPDDIMIAWGIYTQQVFVIPGERMVIARIGNDASPDNDAWDEVEFLTMVLNSVIEPAGR
ncbi:MAG TPA: serine hydrolase [Acidobacteriota bacterium]|nr:serine hydrolase [Acidobacteriota bacterium]